MPVDTVLPHIDYQDLHAAIDFLTRVFGFVEHYRYGEPISGAQMYAGKACIMVKGTPDQLTPAQLVLERSLSPSSSMMWMRTSR